MNHADLQVLSALLAQTRTIVDRLGCLCRFESTDDHQLLQEVDALAIAVGDHATAVQYRESVSWRDNQHPPRHPAPRHLQQPRSTTASPRVAVQRFRPSGDEAHAAPVPKELSGQWDPFGHRRRAVR